VVVPRFVGKTTQIDDIHCQIKLEWIWRLCAGEAKNDPSLLYYMVMIRILEELIVSVDQNAQRWVPKLSVVDLTSSQEYVRINAAIRKCRRIQRHMMLTCRESPLYQRGVRDRIFASGGYWSRCNRLPTSSGSRFLAMFDSADGRLKRPLLANLTVGRFDRPFAREITYVTANHRLKLAQETPKLLVMRGARAVEQLGFRTIL
jgi:hypothetical protein